MSLQSIRMNRPILNNPRASVANQMAHPSPVRALRRNEAAVVDGMQAWVRGGHSLAVLIGVDHPGPAFEYDLPALTADAPLTASSTPSPFAVFTQLLSTISNMPGARAAERAAAHSLSLTLSQSTTDGFRPPSDGFNPAIELLQLLERFAHDAPLVIHLGHLQRADAASLELLRDLVQALGDRPMLIAGTYRADQPYPVCLSELLNSQLFLQAAFGPTWSNDLVILLDNLFGRKAPLGSIIEAAKSDDRLLLLGGVSVIEACGRSGRWTDGLTLSERVLELAQSVGAEYVAAAARLARTEITCGLGQWTEALAEFDQIAASPAIKRDRNLAAAAAWGVYKAQALQDETKRRAGLPDALRRWRAHGRTSADPAAAAALMADVVDYLVDANRLREAQSWQRDLEALVAHSGHPAARAAVALSLGTLLSRSNDWRASVGAYRAAIQHASALHDMLGEARANNGLALALLEIGDTESKSEGRERLSLAHSVLARLNARPDVEKCEAGAKRFGLRPRQRRPSAANRTPGSLTRREREVLALVMNGLTNRQIANRLTISEKTAEGHVGNILAKLSCSSRIKAAELARATGLLEGSPA